MVHECIESVQHFILLICESETCTGWNGLQFGKIGETVGLYRVSFVSVSKRLFVQNHRQFPSSLVPLFQNES